MHENQVYRIPMIGNRELDWLEQSIKLARNYDDHIARALIRTIKVIHGLKDFHKQTHPGQFDIYIGRCSNRADQLIKRWQAHHKSSKKHDHGIVLFTCSTKRVKHLEEIGIKILQALKARGTLCVGCANIHSSSAGKLPSSTHAVIYLTWRVKEESEEWDKATTPLIYEIASEVASQVDDVKTPQLARGLKYLKRLSTKVKLVRSPD
ncbi:MAG: hypothetical protein HY281_06525 [Nitrospirae bacterium]|nr:hypothetical protein [Nitrospirota bacterium]